MNIQYILKAQIKIRNYQTINIPQTQKHNCYLETLTFLKHKTTKVRNINIPQT